MPYVIRPSLSVWRGGLCISDHFCRRESGRRRARSFVCDAPFGAPLFRAPTLALSGFAGPAGRRWAFPRCCRCRRRRARASVYMPFGEIDPSFWWPYFVAWRPVPTKGSLFPSFRLFFACASPPCPTTSVADIPTICACFTPRCTRGTWTRDRQGGCCFCCREKSKESCNFQQHNNNNNNVPKG